MGVASPLQTNVLYKLAVPGAGTFPALSPVENKFRDSLLNEGFVDTSPLQDFHGVNIWLPLPGNFDAALLCREYSFLFAPAAHNPRAELGSPAVVGLIALAPVLDKFWQALLDKALA